jgi:two-component system cell cycle response regulator DivK
MKERNDNEHMKTVLFIDDDSRNIFALTAVLKSRNIRCVTTGSAAEGIDLIASNPAIKLVLMDMMMPEMDGYEAIRHIRRSERRSIPIVAVTAQAMVGDRDKCIAAGADSYLAKPIDVDLLMELINTLGR